MKKYISIILILLLIAVPAFSANKWRDGDGSETPTGTDLINDLDAVIDTNIVQPIDRLLSDYREDVKITYDTAAQITVGSGEVVCSNSAGTIRRFRQNTSSTTVTWSDIDTGAEVSGTTYYLYADCDADATTFVVKISASSSAPSGVTYYKKLGQFFNNASSNILNDETLINDNDYYAKDFGDWETKTIGTTYLATTDGFAVGRFVISSTSGGLTGQTDSATTPTTTRNSCFVTSSTEQCNITMPVKRGDYYHITQNSGSGGTVTMFWIPLQ